MFPISPCFVHRFCFALRGLTLAVFFLPCFTDDISATVAIMFAHTVKAVAIQSFNFTFLLTKLNIFICTKCCVLFTARIVDSSRVYTHRLFEVNRIRGAAVYDICHIKTSRLNFVFCRKKRLLCLFR